MKIDPLTPVKSSDTQIKELSNSSWLLGDVQAKWLKGTSIDTGAHPEFILHISEGLIFWLTVSRA